MRYRHASVKRLLNKFTADIKKAVTEHRAFDPHVQAEFIATHLEKQFSNNAPVSNNVCNEIFDAQPFIPG